jgi:hypothetical protein
MLGVTLFIYFVLRYAGSRMETVALRIRDTG